MILHKNSTKWISHQIYVDSFRKMREKQKCALYLFSKKGHFRMMPVISTDHTLLFFLIMPFSHCLLPFSKLLRQIRFSMRTMPIARITCYLIQKLNDLIIWKIFYSKGLNTIDLKSFEIKEFLFSRKRITLMHLLFGFQFQVEFLSNSMIESAMGNLIKFCGTWQTV